MGPEGDFDSFSPDEANHTRSPTEKAARRRPFCGRWIRPYSEALAAFSTGITVVDLT